LADAAYCFNGGIGLGKGVSGLPRALHPMPVM
jgi:hypothetical protein